MAENWMAKFSFITQLSFSWRLYFESPCSSTSLCCHAMMDHQS